MKKTVLTILLAMISFIGQFCYGALQQDTYLWTTRDAGGAGVKKMWSSVAISSDGMKLVACAQMDSGGAPDYVYTSSDGGAIWTKRTPAGTGVAKYWSAAAINADGTKMAVCADYIYTSIYSGASWVKRSPAGTGITKSWYSVAMSSDGSHIAGCAYDDYVYTSADGGASWKKREPAGSGQTRKWYSAAMSSDGLKVTVIAYDDFLYTSTDGGDTWTQRDPSGNDSNVTKQWGSVAMSSDGAVIAVSTEGTAGLGTDSRFFIYVSTDGGAIWAQKDPSSGTYKNETAVAMDSTGSKIIAAPISSDYVFNSSDGGANWTQSSPAGVGANRSWYSIAMSSNGRKVATCAHDPDYVYTATSNKLIQFQAGANGTLDEEALSISQSVPVGSDCTAVTAIAATHYHFEKWTLDGAGDYSTDNPLTVKNVSDSMTLTANFARDMGKITTEVIGSGTITPDSGTFSTDMDIGITALADAGFTFVNFSVFGDATLSTTDTPSTFKLIGLDGCSAKITACFLEDANELLPAVNTPTIVPALTKAKGSFTVYKFTVPAGLPKTTKVVVSTSLGGGGAEDCDMYISPDVIPTLDNYFARSTGPTSKESITVLNPEITDWYVLLYGYDSYSGVDLTISLSDDVPDKPTLLTATQDLTGTVDLTWSSVSGAVSYDIFRAREDSSDLAEFIKNIAGETTSTGDDDTALVGTQYFYWVTSRKGAGVTESSDFSNSRQVWTIDGSTTRNLTSGVTVSALSGAVGYTRIFTFTVPVIDPVVKLLEIKTSGGTGDCDLYVEKDGAEIYGVKATNNETIRIEKPAGGTIDGEYTISLYANTAYSGLSLRAKYFNAKPAAPSSIAASDGTCEEAILVSWASSDGAASYEIWRGTTNKSADSAKIAEVSDTSYVDSSNAVNMLSPTATYYYWVKAGNGAGTSGFNASSNSGYISRIPAASSSVAASDGTYFDKIRVTWPKVAGATYYRIYRNTSGTFNEIDFIDEVPYVSSTTTYSYDDAGATDPKPGTKYWYYVKSANGNGVSSGYKSGSGYIRSAGPAGLTASNGTFFDKVKITWTEVPGATEYEIYRSTTNSSPAAIVPAPPPITTNYYYDENPGGKFYYWVKAKYSYPGPGSYTSAFSASNSGYPKDVVTSLAAPVLKSVSNGTSEKVSIVWGEVPAATKYTVFRRILSTDSWTAIPAATEITDLFYDDDPPLPLGQKYMYCVKAWNEPAGIWSGYSASKTGYKAGTSTPFSKGDPVVFVSDGNKGEKLYQITVDPGMSRLIAKVENGTGDCDLYAKFGSYPTTASYNAKGTELAGGAETLSVAKPAAGTWYILLYGAGASGYSNVQFSASYYGAANIVLTSVPADDQAAPFTAAFKGQVLDDNTVPVGIAGLTVGARDPMTGLTKWLTKTDAKGNFSYSTKISADGEYTYDFYLSAIPDSTLSIASWTVKTRRNPRESGGLFDFSGYLAGYRIPVSTIVAQGGTLAGLEEYMNTRRGFADGPAVAASTYENIWLTNSIGAAATDNKITSKLDSGLYMLFYGTEGAAVGNGPATAAAGLLANPLLVRVSPAKQSATITNLKTNGLVDNAFADNIANGGIGVVVIAAVSNPDEIGDNYDYDVSLYASEQLELLANIANDNEFAPNLITPENKYGTGTLAKFVNVTLNAGTRKIGVAVSSFLEKTVPAP